LDKFRLQNSFPEIQKKPVYQNFGFSGPQNVVYQQINLNLNPLDITSTSKETTIAAILSQLTALASNEPLKSISEEKKFDDLPELIDLTDIDDIVSKDLGKIFHISNESM